MDPVTFGVLTASDRAAAGDYDDLSGPAIAEFLSEAISNPFKVERRIIPDEQKMIEASLIELCNAGCSVIIAPFSNRGERIIGAIGVVGPTRMNYGRIIPMVDYTAKIVGGLIG